MNTTIIVNKETAKKLHKLKHKIESNSLDDTIKYLIDVFYDCRTKK